MKIKKAPPPHPHLTQFSMSRQPLPLHVECRIRRMICHLPSSKPASHSSQFVIKRMLDKLGVKINGNTIGKKLFFSYFFIFIIDYFLKKYLILLSQLNCTKMIYFSVISTFIRKKNFFLEALLFIP